MKQLAMIAACLLLTGGAFATTNNPAPNVYEVTAGVEFSISNAGAADYLFSWADGGGAYVNVVDPTLILHTGETYVFRRASGSHPLAITDDSLPVAGTDGDYGRTSSSGTDIDAATLSPVADFTADPAPTTDAISWSPGDPDVGVYYYTCTVPFHTAMTGKIEVSTGGSVATEAISWSQIKALYRQ